MIKMNKNKLNEYFVNIKKAIIEEMEDWYIDWLTNRLDSYQCGLWGGDNNG